MDANFNGPHIPVFIWATSNNHHNGPMVKHKSASKSFPVCMASYEHYCSGVSWFWGKKKMTAVDDAFNSFFFGSGSWLGLMLFLILFVGLMLKWKYSVCFLIPISVFMGLEYLNQNLAWQGLIMLFMSPFMVGYLIKTGRG